MRRERFQRRVFVHAQRLDGDGEGADDHDAAHDPEDAAQELVHAGEHGDANVMSKYHRHRAAQQEHAYEDDQRGLPKSVRETLPARRPDAARASCAKIPGEHDGEEPGDDRDGFAEQAANQAHDG